jgi:hypothetical protein
MILAAVYLYICALGIMAICALWMRAQANETNARNARNHYLNRARRIPGLKEITK